MKRSLSLLLAAAMLMAAPAAQAQKLNFREKRTMELSPAVVLIIVSYEVTMTLNLGKERQAKVAITESGTGFIYRPDGYIITAGHVVMHANLKDIHAQEDLKGEVLNGFLKPQLSKWIGEIEEQVKRKLTEEDMQEVLKRLTVSQTPPELRVFLANRKAYAADIKAYGGTLGEGKDIAIVKIDASNLPTVKLGNSDNLHVQEGLTVIGYPGAASPIGELKGILANESIFTPSITNGHVSAVKADYHGTPVIQTDAASTHGNSGGPAFNDAGEAVGVCDFGPNTVSGFSFFIPINTAWEFVRQAGSNPESGLFNQLWAEALDSYDAGKCTTAKEKFTDVLRIIPGEPDAQRLSAAAEACSANQSPMASIIEKGNPVIYAVGGVILLLALFFVLRKKPAAGVAVAGAGPGIAGGPQVGVAPPPPVMMPPPGLPPGASFGSVQITSGALSGRRFPITKEGLLIGRDPAKCQVVLNEDTVSKEHAWIVPVESGVVVIDRGSANGTFVNSIESPRVSKVGLQNGDRVFIGKAGATVLTYYSS